MTNGKRVLIGVFAIAVLVAGSMFGAKWLARRNALAALDAPNPTPEQIELIVGLVADESTEVMMRAGNRLLEIGTDALPAIHKACVDAEPRVQQNIIMLTLNIDEDEGLKAIEVLTRSPHVDARFWAVQALAEIDSGNPRVPEVLKLFADDPDPKVRRAVAQSIPVFGLAAAKDTLEAMKSDSDPGAARHAANRLAELEAKRGRR